MFVVHANVIPPDDKDLPLIGPLNNFFLLPSAYRPTCRKLAIILVWTTCNVI